MARKGHPYRDLTLRLELDKGLQPLVPQTVKMKGLFRFAPYCPFLLLNAPKMIHENTKSHSCRNTEPMGSICLSETAALLTVICLM